MGVSSIGASSSYAVSGQQRPPQRPDDAISQGVDSLMKAVQSGDKDSIQTAYDSLTKATGSSSSSSSTSSSSSSAASDKNNPINKLLSTVGEALESGDVSGLAQTLAAQGPGGVGGPGGAGGPPPGGPPPGGGPGGGPGGTSDSVKEGISSLAESLSSGDTESAQSAYSALADVLASEAESGASAPEEFTSKLSDIGSALSSGNLSSAKDLFSSLLPRGSSLDTAA